MGVSSSTYYGFTRIRGVSPEAQDWAAVDKNPELTSLVLKMFEQHSHDAAAPMDFPGYNSLDLLDPNLAVLSEITTGGAIQAGTTVAVRLSYVNSLGLETEAAPEAAITLAAPVSRPLTPGLTSSQVASPGLPGGAYIYAMTKRKGTGETVISDILSVNLGFDTTRSVTLAFDPISSYTDGTDSLNIYRSTGLNSSFQLVTTITSTSQVAFTDTNNIAAPNVSVQPPTTTTFNASRKVRITLSGITPHPPTASKLRIYVSQQAGLWGTAHLLSELDIATLPSFVDYIGTEALAPGWPSNSTQIPANPPKINLSTQATGAPTLTANMNFAGFQAQNLKLHNNAGVPSSPTNGFIYYDTSTNKIRGYQNGSWIDWGATAITTFTHSAEEAGGHVSANIKYLASSTNTVKTVLDRISVSTGTTTAGNAKQVQLRTGANGTTSNPNTTNTSPNTLYFVPEMSITAPATTFVQQDMRIEFTGTFYVNVATACGFIFEVAGVQYSYSARYYQAPIAGGFYFQAHLVTTTGASSNGVDAGGALIKVLWWTNAGTLTAVNNQRTLEARLVF